MSLTILAGTVLTMTDRGVLHDQAITVTDGRITQVRPREESTVSGTVVDWRDRTVLPGLTDCHVHVEERADLLANLAHGVTTVRNMRGNPWHLWWRKQVDEGRELGPRVVTSTPMADGRGAPGTTVWPNSALITDRDSAHAAVSRWAELGYDQVKAYQWLSAEALAGLGEACRATGMPLVGHCPQELTIGEAIDRGQTGFEHLNNYEYGSLRPASQERLDAFFARGFSYADRRNRFAPEVAEVACDLDPAKITALAQRLADEDIMSCPTLIVLDRLLGHRDMTEPRLAYVDPAQARTWRSENDFRIQALPPEDLQQTGEMFNRRALHILAELRAAGAPVLVGTDSHNAFVFQGSSVVEELELMVAAGYTPAELTQIATRGTADYLGLTDSGRVEAGYLADLVAVTGDPLSSVTALRDPAGVVMGGTVLERTDLDALLEEAERLLHASPDPDQLQAVPAGETHVGDYARTSFGADDALTRVSSAVDTATGSATWREQVVTRERTEVRTAVLDARGRLVSAEVDRRSAAGRESATVTSGDAATYRVRASLLDGSTLDAQVPGPLLPGADLGVPAVLAALELAGGDGPHDVLTLSTALANSLDPVPGTIEADEETEGGRVQRTTDAVVRLAGSDDLATYTMTAPMRDHLHRRTP